MKNITILCPLIFVLFNVIFPARAAEVHALTATSHSMGKDMDVVVITPEGYSKTTNYPVMYLLHGYGGNQNDWVKKVPEIKDYADLYNTIIVCPDGGHSSWYFDSPIDEKVRYETYISVELIGWVDSTFSTVASRDGRAITGLSMGGHGALYLAFRNQDVFGAAGSMSGGVDLRPFPLNWDIADQLGDYAEHPENWENNSVLNLVFKLTPDRLKIIFDCGTEDFFYEVNYHLHERLVERNIPHSFTIRPGAHNWDYWSNAIAYHCLFFHFFFTQSGDD